MKLQKHVIVASIFIFGLLSFSPHVFAETNVLTNPGAESGSTTGWDIIASVGDGWSVNFDGFVRTGTYAFMPSYGLSRISQTVNLSSAGYSAERIDTLQPTITMNVYTRTRNDQAGYYYVTYKLLAADGTTVIASSGDTHGNSGSPIALSGDSPYTARSYTFTNYGAGVRYVYIEFGGSDSSVWAGHYGTHFDDASITLADVSTLNLPSVPIIQIIPLGTENGNLDFLINNGASKTNTRTIDLAFNADPARVVRYAVSLDPDFTDVGQVDYMPNTQFSLPDVPGTYTVYVMFFSPTGHSVKLSKSIQYGTGKGNTSDVAKTGMYTRNLRQGSTGDDVKALQQFLNKNGFVISASGDGSLGNETTVYGKATARALAKFQEAHADILLTPQGLTKGTGIFGPATRKFVNSQ